jgi:hypothetical protein
MGNARQKPEPVLSISRFFTGLVSQRSPLNTPFAYAGLNMIQRNDALIGGLNCELTNNYTLQRRGGFPRYCAQTFAANEFPLAYFSARINGQVVSFVDTNLAVYTFTPSALKLLFTKSAGAGQTHFLQVGNIIYFANGVDNKKWAPPKTVWAAGTAFALGTLIIDTNGNIQQVTTAGTSGGSQPAWNTTPITGTTADGGTLVWTNRGNQVSNWGINAPASAPTASPTTAGNGACRFWWPNTAYTLGGGQYSIIDTNGNVQAIQAPGTSGANAPVWTTTPQTNVQDNTLSWGCVTAPGTWTPNTLIFATNGAVIDSNNNLQVAQTGGSTGAAAPAWNAAFNGTTVDNAVTWLNVGSAKFLAFRGYQWVFAYHTCYGHVSTASPITPSTGPIIGSSYSVPLSGPGSTDPQCDYVWLFRIRDGGSVFEFMGQVANPGAGTWNFTDNIIDANLEDQLIAAQDHLNDPPPAGMTVLSWHMKRPWGGVGNTMQFGIGPDKIIGVAEECWPPANEETFASNVQKLASTTQGLCILTSDQWWVEMGGPQTLSFWPQKILDNFGISSPNCLAQDGDQIFIYTTSKQLWSLSLGNGKEEDGFAVGDLLAAGFNSTTTYLTIHRNGTDVGVFLSDGSTNIFRYSLMLNCWSTLYQPAGGVGAIGSIETSFGTYSLLASRPVGGGAIMARSLTSFYDDIASATYPWNAQIGSVHLSQPGTPVQELDNIVIQTTNAGTELTLGVRINEIAGDFIPIPGTADDPFDLPPKTMRSRRHDLRDNQEAQPIQIRHMQLQISGVAEDAKSEVLGIHFCPQAA